jgi:hypothetical protein
MENEQSGDRRTFEHHAANAITERADAPPLESAHLGIELASFPRNRSSM